MGKLILISGDDEFAVKAKARETAAALADGVAPEDDPAFEIIIGDGEERSRTDRVSGIVR